MRVLTLDLGSGALKACLWDGGVIVRFLEAPISLHLAGDAAEQSPAEWWDAAVRLTRGLDAGPVDCIGVTGHMHALVPTGADGEPLGPAAVVPDRRARAACRELASEFGAARILGWTGGRLDPTCALAKARHFAPDAAWRAARWLLPPKDFLRMRLTGEAATDPIDAAGTMLWDIGRGDWHPALAAFAGGVAPKLPPVHPTVSVAGALTRRAAEALGLLPGTPVATGGGDDIETLGAGALQVGDLFEHLGTTGSIYLAADTPRLDPDGQVEAYPDVVPGRWLLGGSTSAAGAALGWALGATGAAGDWAALDRLFADMAAPGAPGEAVFLPYLSGERAPLWDPQRSGAFLGLRAAHDAAALRQAAAEGVLYSLRAVLDAVTALAPAPGRRVVTSGPLGRQEALGQVRADVYDAEVVSRGRTGHATSLAAMILAACAVSGDDPYRMAEGLLPVRWRCRPRPQAVRAYARGYGRFAQAGRLLAAFDVEEGDL